MQSSFVLSANSSMLQVNNKKTECFRGKINGSVLLIKFKRF